MDIKHGNPNRREVMKKTIESADGKFKFQVILDFMQNMPEEYKYVPFCGNIAGGCCDKDGNIYCGLRGGSFMSPFPLSCYLELDKDGNFVRAVGSGNIPGMHFGEISPDGKKLLFADVGGCRFVGLDLETGEAKTALAPFHERPQNNVNKNALTDWRMHKGVIATEPLHEEGCGGSFEWYQQRAAMTLGEPFHNPTDIDYDSQGNMYISDGYGNCAVHKFDKDGNFVKTWGGNGYDHFFDNVDTPGKFLVPHSLAVDAKDHIWVCDREKDAVHVFDTDGNLLFYAKGDFGQPSGVDANSKYIYVCGRAGYLTIFDTDFNIVAELGEFNGDLRAHSVACDEDGNVYLFPTHANTEHQVIALKAIK